MMLFNIVIASCELLFFLVCLPWYIAYLGKKGVLGQIRKNAQMVMIEDSYDRTVPVSMQVPKANGAVLSVWSSGV